MTFDQVRQLGAAVLASAGIAGIILGLAAQRTLGNLIAGLQIAFTQPLRIDDVVIVEGEWGRIEEITLTYVVVRIWDLRRLIVPITYFVETPFQNWTRTSAELLGTVFSTWITQCRSMPYGRVASNPGEHEALGPQGRPDPGYQRLRADDRAAGPDERPGRRDRLGPAMPCPREADRIRSEPNYPDALPRLRTQFEESQNRDSDDA
jgi:hypothetical protein